jgi:cytochrome c553
MRRRVAIVIVIFVAAVFAASFLPRSSAQNRDRFSHASVSHKKLECSSCHKLPTSNWVATRGFPDVAQFPGHAACASCHRRDFFVGNKAGILRGLPFERESEERAALPVPGEVSLA